MRTPLELIPGNKGHFQSIYLFINSTLRKSFLSYPFIIEDLLTHPLIIKTIIMLRLLQQCAPKFRRLRV